MADKITWNDKNHVIPYGTREIQVWDLDMNEIKDVVNSHADDIDINSASIVGLEAGQTGGLKSFTTLALLQAYATPDINDSYKVTNDPTPSLNGYYHWVSGTNYVKDSSLNTGEVASGDVDAVEGGKIFDHGQLNYTTNSIFQKDSTFSDNVDRAQALKYGIKSLSLSEVDETKFYTFFQIQVITGFSKIFVAKMINTTSTPSVGDIICSYNESITSSGREVIELTEYASSGVTGRIEVDWDILNGTNTQGFSYEKAGLDFTILLNSSRRTISTISKQYAYREGKNLWIASKWDNENDLIVTFGQEDDYNNKILFRRVGLATSFGDISKEVKRDIEQLFVKVGATSDNIGPWFVNGEWAGGGHAYPANDADPKYPTADLLSYEYYADGKVMPDGKLILCDAVQVIANHEIYDPVTTPTAPVVVINERLSFNVIGGNIETMVEFEAVNNFTLTNYYGMQTISHPQTNPWQDKVYFAHSNVNNQIQNWAAGLPVGNLATSPNVEKSIISRSDFSFNLAMSLDLDNGLPTERASNITSGVMFTSGTKTYWRLLQNSQSITSGYRKYWRGVYNYFKNESTAANYTYFQYEGNDKFLIVDFIDKANDNYKVFAPGIQNQDIEIINKDSTLTIDLVVKPDGIEFDITGYGNAKIKV